MKLKKQILTAVLAFAGAALLHTSASAATSGDLFLGFQITDGSNPGLTSNLEVDLGAASTFTSMEGTGDVVNLNTTGAGTSGLSVADLVATYGSNWNSRALAWGIAGNKATSKEIWITQDPSAAVPVTTSNVTASGFLSNLINGFASGTASSNSTNSIINGTSTAGSWTYQITNQGTNPPGDDFGLNYSVEQSVSSTGVESLILYDMVNTPNHAGTEVGTFTLGSDGTFTFTATGTAATPEPSAYALGLCAMLLLFVLKRRHSIRA